MIDDAADLALALGWTLRDVLAHTPRELHAMTDALDRRERSRSRAAAHARSRSLR